jgi:hypothetical protein
VAQRKRTAQTQSANVTSGSAASGAEDTNVADMPNANDVNVHADAIKPEPTALSLAIDNVREIEDMLAIATRPTIKAALETELAEARGALALLEAEAMRQLERETAEAEARASVEAISNPERRERALGVLLAAIEAEFAPLPAPEAELAAPEVYVGRRPASDRQHERNAAVAADPQALARGAALYAAFDADSATLRCKIGRAPNTRFPSVVALAPSGAGVANAADYDTAVRAVRAHMLASGWPKSAKDGDTTAESKWLAARGRFAAGQPKHNERAACSFGSAAEIALYADGRFRLALPNTADVRFLSRDNAAWQAFVGVTAGAAEHASSAPQAAPQAPTVKAEAEVYGSVAKTAICACGAKYIVGHMTECRACGAKVGQ